MASLQDTLQRFRQVLSRVPLSRFGGRMGLAVVAIGLIVIGIGWNGAAGSGGEINHVPVVQAQLPWLLSGGFLGLGLVVLGAALLVAHTQREGQQRLRRDLEALTEAVERLGRTAAVPDDLGGLVVAGSASYHVPRCHLVQGRQDTRALTVDQAVEEGLTPCRICHPPLPAAPHPQTP